MNDHPSQVMPRRASIQGLQLLESCSFHWIFDGATRRFRRTPPDAAIWPEWAWLHIKPCQRCGRDVSPWRVGTLTIGERRTSSG